MPDLVQNFEQQMEDEFETEELPSDIHQVNEPMKKQSSFISSKPPLLKSPAPLKKRLNIPEAFMKSEVELNGKSLSDIHIQQLVQCIKVTKATSLDVSNNRLSDEAILMIAKAMATSPIETLDISNNKMTDQCAEPLMQILKVNRTLKTLRIEGISNRVSKNRLKNGLPKINIIL